MNSSRILARRREWISGLDTVFSRVKPRSNCRRDPEAAPCHSRSQATDASEKPRRTAIDLARKVQQERTTREAAEPPVSGQQRRVMELKRFSLQLQNVHPNVLAKHLHRSVLYQDKHVVVINKPFGVPVRDDSRVTSISSVLPVLSKMMDGMKVKSDSQMLPSLGLEKEATGVLLLARSEEAVEHILNLHRNNQVQRKYWVITVGVPVPSEGVIDIPIIEREVTGPRPHYKMALSPLFRMNDAGDGVTKVRAHRQAHPAVTKYRVLDSSSGCSLVELQPFTGVKHQMRVHMALALACPILGDHKYSHSSKLAPQKLPERVLGKLGLEQSKIRYLPLHLHARQLTVSGASQADIDVSCPLPKYFTQTLKQLHLSLTDEK
ncbi:mitochondrial RNA pseudouridine synthase rpusd4-like [Seriola lalandi dorsalis]|uniref:Pseudouridylate synthase RPUSD4, mitochondrial n=1 Tax=Seriola lalandi dorsalis TaxID=1841481 RepID=A0A3B4Z633_SERLL|nr:mitochondrial RNA pseudouridine synthase rpusd4-like [Seriola lalandi dorsalis]XP_056246026.1 pseudouridylate synthase RPUSD4, mitochondrial-like [Seriola aureovittata]